MAIDLPLAHPDAHAILIGSPRYYSPSLNDVPSISKTIEDLGEVIVKTTGVNPANVETFTDLETGSDFSSRVLDKVQNVTGALLFYYVGHGLKGSSGDLFLSVKSTNPSIDRLEFTGVRYRALGDILRSSPARSKTIVLDCCFSGLATELLDAAALEDELTSIPIGNSDEYTCVAAACPPDERAFAPHADEYTAFSGELIKALEHGEPHSPDLLRLLDIRRILTRRLQSRGLPTPKFAASDETLRQKFFINRYLLSAAHSRQAIPPEVRYEWLAAVERYIASYDMAAGVILFNTKLQSYEDGALVIEARDDREASWYMENRHRLGSLAPGGHLPLKVIRPAHAPAYKRRRPLGSPTK